MRESGSTEGLTSVEASRRLAEYGPNEPAPVRRLSLVVQFLQLFANPLVIILLVASAIAGSLGQQVDALIIVTMVMLGVAINFWQSYRSQQAAERLRASVVPPSASSFDAWDSDGPVRSHHRNNYTTSGARSAHMPLSWAHSMAHNPLTTRHIADPVVKNGYGYPSCSVLKDYPSGRS